MQRRPQRKHESAPARTHTDRTFNIPEKISVGIACVRMHPVPQILCVRKRHTYAYGLFVNGRYKHDNDRMLISLFSKMTVEEKLTLCSLNFPQIWYSIWVNEPQMGQKYERARGKFNQHFVLDGGTRLRMLIAQAVTSQELVWEIPKGRRNANETDIQCAIREFFEETRVSKRAYTLRPDSFTYSYVSDGVRYTNIYYFALANSLFQPYVDVCDIVQSCEIGAVSWLSMQEIKSHDPTGRLAKCARRAINYAKSRF
jgi:8-oxo-dGTP pyrophosphatase MutT (NUDIX family)